MGKKTKTKPRDKLKTEYWGHVCFQIREKETKTKVVSERKVDENFEGEKLGNKGGTMQSSWFNTEEAVWREISKQQNWIYNNTVINLQAYHNFTTYQALSKLLSNVGNFTKKVSFSKFQA